MFEADVVALGVALASEDVDEQCSGSAHSSRDGIPRASASSPKWLGNRHREVREYADGAALTWEEVRRTEVRLRSRRSYGETAFA
jgi:hypothetical protein